MDYNPLTARLQDAEKAVTALRRRRTAVAGELKWATEFKLDAAQASLTRLKEDLKDRTADLQHVSAKCGEAAATSQLMDRQLAELEDQARIGLNPGRWFSHSRAVAKDRLQKERGRVQQHLQVVEALTKQRDDAEAKVQRIRGRISATERDIAKFTRFKPQVAQDELNNIDSELLFREIERDDLRARKQEVDRRLQAPLLEIARCRADIADMQSTIDDLIRQGKKYRSQRKRAAELDKGISNAPNGYERHLLHEQSERELGNSSPGRVVAEADRQLRRLQDSIAYNERGIARAERDIAKIERRIRKMAEVASRDIRLLIIDGKNLCYEHNAFIGLAALIPVTERLSERFDVTVIFDASIRRDMSMSDDQLAKAIPAAKVHVVASRVKADETILDAAHESTAWVISNDRYSDYRDKAAVNEGRVIRHEILHGRVMIHDLDLSTQFSSQGRI